MGTLITIDQSYTNTAWVVWEDELPKHFGVIRSNKDEVIYQRAEFIANNLIEVVRKYKPDHLVIEQIAFGGFGNASKDLAGLLWVILVALKRATHLGYEDYTLVTPTSAKKVHTGSGKASKQQMLAAVPEEVVKKFSKHYLKTKGLYDLADAYAFGKWYFNKQEKK